MIHNLALAAYPVGSIYMSVNSASPADLFGGVWERIKDAFLLAAGDTYAAGHTGGSATVTLTTEQIPSHAHGMQSHTHTTALGSHAHEITQPKVPSRRVIDNNATGLSGTGYGISNAATVKHGGGAAVLAGLPTDQNTSIRLSGDPATSDYRLIAASTALGSKTSGGPSNNTTTSAGGGKSHSNMPPYLSVYMWKRTA